MICYSCKCVYLVLASNEFCVLFWTWTIDFICPNVPAPLHCNFEHVAVGSPEWPDPGQGARGRPRHAGRLICPPRLEALLRRGVADGGRWGQDPRTFKTVGVDPQKFGCFSNFFSWNVFVVHFPTFSKWSGRNPKRNQILGVGEFGCLWIRPPPPNQNFVATPLLFFL